MTGPGGVTPRHAPPFYCPYCGEEEIRPWGEQAGEWRCDLCLRVWRLRFVGTGARTGPVPSDPDTPQAPSRADTPRARPFRADTPSVPSGADGAGAAPGPGGTDR